MRKLSDCYGPFQDNIKAIAEIAKKTPDEVFTLWREYSDKCSMWDQSAILGEFVDWYVKDLGGDKAALNRAIQS